MDAAGTSEDVERSTSGGTGGAGGAGGHPPATGPSPPGAPWPHGPRLPEPAPDLATQYPESWQYRLKNKLLGPPLTTERLATERLNKRTALAVLSSDVISSSAYATEQALIPLIKVIGIAAFSLLVPVSLAVIVVLLFVTLSYLEVVKVYTKAGGAYVVSRENFGQRVAQVAAISLLVDYTLTVAVSVAAGVAALTSVFPALTPGTTWLAVGLVILIAYANLRGVREAGKVFAVPTYFFILNMAVLIVVGSVKAIGGSLHAHSIHVAGAFPVGHPGSGLLYGAGLFVVLRSFASGGSALTGTEAISNGVTVFRKPESRNARITMVWMAVTLGTLVIGVSSLAAVVHPVPYVSGTPTVIAQLGRQIYGHGPVPEVLFVLLQASTMLILILAANTSFTGFPFLASFTAEDSYLPRALMRRGHRLVFSTGIIVLTVVSCLLLIVTRAQVNQLIPLYAIGVFTGFTMAGAGMVRYHLRHRESQWRRRTVINGVAAVLSFVVDIVIVVTKFTEGAWAIVIILPLGVFVLLRLHHQYEREDEELEAGAVQACAVPVLRRHVVIVLIDQLDLAAARAIQYARSLRPDDVRAVHFDIDSAASRTLQEEWSRIGLSQLPLDVIECRDRRLGRATLELMAELVADSETEVTLLLPRRGFAAGWRRLLHDRTADKIAAMVSEVPHVSATIVPYQLQGRWGRRAERWRDAFEGRLVGVRAGAVGRLGTDGAGGKGGEGRAPAATGARRTEGGRRKDVVDTPVDRALAVRSVGTRRIGEVGWRERARVAGRVRSVRVQPRAGTSNLECVLTDDTGTLMLVFQGRPSVPGIEPGARMVAEGMVGSWRRRLAMLNPDYELIASGEVLGVQGH